MKNYFFIFLLIFNSCKKDNGCDCWGGGTTQKIGTLDLDDSLKNLLRYKEGDSIRLKHSNGLSVTLLGGNYKYGEASDYLMIRELYPDVCCSDNGYYTSKVQTNLFYTKEVPLEITFGIKKNANRNYNSAINIDSLGDVLIIKFRYKQFALPLRNKPNITDIKNNVERLDNYTVAGKNHRNVYHLFYEADNKYISEKGLYFTFEDGLLEYYLTNGEKWTIE